MKRQSERGSAIMMLFIAVALFGMLAYAFMQGSRTSTGWLTSEGDKAAATGSMDCTNAVSMASKRLAARGCDSLISYNQDGSNDNPGAPSDGSCSIYHPNGGGVKLCTGIGACSADELNDLAIGQSCGGVVYAGPAPLGGRLFIPPCDAGMLWNGSTCNGARPYLPWNHGGPGPAADWVPTAILDGDDGAQNTQDLVNADASTNGGTQNHEAALYCDNLFSGGFDDWYLPAINELEVIESNQSSLSGFDENYWSSTESNVNEAMANDLSGSSFAVNKNASYYVRCARREP